VPCGAGEQHNNRTKREGVSRARIYHWNRYGAPGEQQHLPDWIDTMEVEIGALAPWYNVLRRNLNHAEETNRASQAQASS